MTVDLTPEQVRALIEAADALPYHTPGLSAARDVLRRAQGQVSVTAHNPETGPRVLRFRAGKAAL